MKDISMTNSQSYFSNQFYTHYRPLCLYALRFLENVEEAEDVVQDVFTKLWERKETLHEITSIKSYLYIAVRNNCLMQLRSKKEFDDVDELQLLEDISEEDRIIRAEMEAQLWQFIDELPERQRQIFLMAKRDGIAYKDIAEESGLSVKTVENYVTRALKSLRKKNFKLYLFFFV